MILLILLFTLLDPIHIFQSATPKELIGAWEAQMPDGTQGLWILDDGYFSITYYKNEYPEFISTEGGTWKLASNGNLQFRWEYNTKEPQLVGQQNSYAINKKGKELKIANTSWKQVDNGAPGALKGAWLITGRMRNGEMNTMSPGARKTMKILSGTRFQWIAYNSETGEFFGTGGGSYSTKDGKYTENINFFSRDNSRVGDRLEFDYKLEDGQWHHSGKSSKGEPLYEIWSTRQSLGI